MMRRGTTQYEHKCRKIDWMMTAGVCHDLALKNSFQFVSIYLACFEAAASSFVLTRPFHF